MVGLFNFFIERFRVTLFLTFIAIIIGLFGLIKINKEIFPNVATGNVSIVTIYPGSSSEESLDNVTKPIEDEIRRVDGIKDIKSISRPSRSKILIRVDVDNFNLDKVTNDIRRAVDRAQNLPAEILDDPEVEELNTSKFPILKIALMGSNDNRNRDNIANNLRDEIELLSGVSKVKMIGYSDRQFQILLNSDKMSKNNISINDVILAIKSQIQDIPAGEILQNNKQKLVRFVGKVKTKEKINDIIIRANFDGSKILLKDVAKVKDGSEEYIDKAIFNGQEATILEVIKKPNADIVKTADKVLDLLSKFFNQNSSNINYKIYDSEAKRVIDKLDIIYNNTLVGFILIIILLLIFFPTWPAILTAFSLPIALLLAIGLVPAFDLSFNKITLMAIIVAIGLMIDNSIVISENFIRLRNEGFDQVKSAKLAVGQFYKPIFATSLTTIAAFIPLLITKGVMGDVIRAIPIVITIAILVSIFECFIILPARLRFSMKKTKAKTMNHENYHIDDGWFGKFQILFEKKVIFFLKHKYKTILSIILLILMSFSLNSKFNHFELFPQNDVEEYQGDIELEIGTTLDDTLRITNQYAKQVALALSEKANKPINVIVNAGSSGGNALEAASQYADNRANIRVIFSLDNAKNQDTETILKIIRSIKAQDIISTTWLAQAEGPPVGKALEVTLVSDNKIQLNLASDFLMDQIKVDGVFDIISNRDFGIDEIRVKINDQLIKAMGISHQKIGNILRSSFEGNDVTSLNINGDEVDIRVRYNKENRQGIDNILQTKIESSSGELVELRNLVTLNQVKGSQIIRKYQYKKSVTISADVDNNKMTSLSLNLKVKNLKNTISEKFPEVQLYFLGQDESLNESLTSLLMAFIISILFIFATLLILFNSFSKSIIVLSSIPLGFIGLFMAFIIHGLPLSFFALVGMVGLSGIIINDTIILVSFIELLKKEQKFTGSKLLARATSARLKPVLITTLTTSFGLFPTAYGIGGYDSALIPLTLGMAWGLLCGTILLLIMTPCLIAIIDEFKAMSKKL